GRSDADHVRVRLGMYQAGKSVAGAAPNARAELRLGLIQHDAVWRVERVKPGARQVVMQLLNARLVRQRWQRIRSRCRRLGRIFPACAMHLVHLLGLGVVRLHVVITDWPGWRDSVVMLELAEVFLAQSVQRGAIQLGGAAYPIVHPRLKGLVVLVVPGLSGHVAVLDADLVGCRGLESARHPAPALKDQNPLAGRRKAAGERAATCATADDDDVVLAIYRHAQSSFSVCPADCHVAGARASGEAPMLGGCGLFRTGGQSRRRRRRRAADSRWQFARGCTGPVWSECGWRVLQPSSS